MFENFDNVSEERELARKNSVSKDNIEVFVERHRIPEERIEAEKRKREMRLGVLEKCEQQKRLFEEKSRLENKLSRLGLFKMKEKKELLTQIESIDNEIKQFKW